jgi:hypothetical protein
VILLAVILFALLQLSLFHYVSLWFLKSNRLSSLQWLCQHWVHYVYTS